MRFCIFIISVFFALNTYAQTMVRTMEGVTEYRLANGLQVLLAPNDLQTRVYANLVVKAGSAVEGFGEGGMAHLLEHLVFKGTPTTRDPMKAFADRSLSFNGTTTADRTNYFAGMNPDTDNLKWYLDWLADASMNSFIAKADLDKEMTVVRNEFERAGSSPERAVYESRMALAFPNHGYGRPTIGNRSDIENVNIERLQAFYKTWYRPDNMVLVVTGKFDAQALLQHVQQVFGAPKNPAQALPTVYTREPVQDGLREATIRRVGTEVSTLIGWRGAPIAHPDDVVLDVIANALVNGGGGRFKTDIERQALGTQVWAWHGAMQHYGRFDVGLRVKSEDKLGAVQTLLLTHIADIAKSGVTQEELERARAALLANFEVTKRSAEGLGAKLAESAGLGDWRLAFWSLDKLKAVTIEDTKRVANAYLVDANRVRVSFIPETHPVRAVDAVPTALNDYVAKPADKPVLPPLARFEPTIAEIDQRAVRVDLKGGTKMVLLARPAVGDAITGTLRIHWGSADSMRGQGVVPYFGALLFKGTSTRSEAQIKDELSRLQSSLSVNTGPGGLTMGFGTTRQNWSAFALLMTDVLRNPKFGEASFKVWQQETISNITKQLDSPEAKADNALRRAMRAPYPADDPRYLPTQEENLARWQALKVEEVREFWRKFAGASVAEFGAAGALDVDDMKADITRMLDDWQTPGGAASYQRIANPLFVNAPKLITIPTPDKPNGLMYSAHVLSADACSREGMAMQLANGILGGGASSRLYTKVRKEEGLSYGVGSYFNPNVDDRVATFGVYGTFAPVNKEKFEAAVKDVLTNAQAKGLSSVELFFAKRIAAERVKQGLASDSYIAGELATAAFKARSGELRDAAWFEEKHAMLQSITIDEVDAAVKKLLDPARFVTVFAGNFN